MEKGRLRMCRQYVHLSFDEVTAEEVGKRRKGEVTILKVAARKMREDGHCFWLSRNGVWLVAAVPPEYLSVISPLN